MAANNYYFFTDTNLLVAQTTGAYGPIPKGTLTDPDEYRVTSLHTASSNPTAYAACDAIVCVQRIPATTPPLVNIILKPLVQPALNFAPVKYIIYKQILASSLINGTDIAASSNNDLTKAIWETQAKKNAKAAKTEVPFTPPNPSAQALGVGLTAATPPVPNDPINDPFNDDQPIDKLFYRTEVSFQLPVVKGGWSIGQFNKDGFGIEVLMEGLNFHHPLLLARQIESQVSTPALAAGATDAEKFDHWHAKEQILGFMDPCAFYGSFFRAGLQAKTSGNAPFATKSETVLYQDVLITFANRNTAYLDIRNEHNFDFNYFGNYNDNVRVGDPLSLVDYYGSGWPILTLTASDFPANNTTKARNAFQLQLPEGDNPKPLIYVSQGYRELRTRGKRFPKELTSAERFFDAFLSVTTGYTTPKATSGSNSLTFVVPNFTGQGATTPVSCYIRIKYLKQRQGATTEPKVVQAANYLDNLVWPIDLNILFEGTANIKSAVYDEEIYVNAQDVDGLRFDCIAKVGIARDADNISLFLVPTNIRMHKGLTSNLVTLSGETSNYSSHYPNFVASKYPLEGVIKSDLNLSPTDTVPVADFVADGWIARFVVPDFNKLLVIVVASTTYKSWKNTIAVGGTLDNRFRIYLGIKNVKTQLNAAGSAYTSFKLVLRGFALASSGGHYEIQEINTAAANSAANVTVYAYASA